MESSDNVRGRRKRWREVEGGGSDGSWKRPNKTEIARFRAPKMKF